MKYKVSILVPVYGVESYIERCARSLFEQTYSDLEFVFVNDCSPDRSIEVLREVMVQYPERKDSVKIINHDKNRGLAAARNTAVTTADGVFLMHVDSDDWVEPNFVELLMHQQQKTGADIVSCNAIVHYSDREEILEEPNYYSKEEMMHSVVQMTLNHVIWRRLIRTSLYRDNGIFAVEGVNIGEDHYTLPRLLFFANSFAKCNNALYHYNCLNSDSYMRSLSSSFNRIKYNNNRDSVDILIDFFKEYDASYLDELYSIKARYIYSQFFPLIKMDEADAYKVLCNDWESIENSYKLALGLTPRRIKLLTSNYELNRIRVSLRIVVKKLFGIRLYEL